MDTIYIRTVDPIHYVQIKRGDRWKCYKVMCENEYFTIIDDKSANKCYYFTNIDNSFDENFDLKIKREICKLDENGAFFQTQKFSPKHIKEYQDKSNTNECNIT